MTVLRTVPTLSTRGTEFGASVDMWQGHHQVISGDMSPLAGLIEARLDKERSDLGDEGFELGGGVLVAHSQTGLYRGSVCAAQLLTNHGALPKDKVTSVPVMAERGVTVSASTVIFSESWCRWLLDAMATVGLNVLLLEAKVEDADRRLNTWPYWRRDRIELICALAKERHIDVIPEVNSPGHMATLLHYYPQYAVRRADGSVDTERLDIGSDEAIGFYLDLVDRYLDVFDSQWWHMGADEYEYHSITYDHFPSLFEAAQRKFGPEGKPTDLFVDFINTVNAHVKSKGKRLRIWNDGITEPNIVTLDSDVTVEYWLNRGLNPSEFSERGYSLMNAAQYLYWSRSVRHIYGVNGRDVFENKMDMLTFDDGSKVSENVTGAKVSIWPDMACAQTENEIIMEVRESLALVAEGCWNGTQPEMSWDDFQALCEAVLPVPDLTPAVTGLFDIPQLSELDPGPWLIEPTYDGYVTISTPAGLRLASGEGRKVMGVVMEVGTPVVLAEPADMSLGWLEGQDSAEERNTQKWTVTGSETLTITAALSGLAISPLQSVDHVDLDEGRGNLGLVPPEMSAGLSASPVDH